MSGEIKGLPKELTLRDYIATAAMQGMLANKDVGRTRDPIEEIISRAAYKIADAMLTERDKP